MTPPVPLPILGLIALPLLTLTLAVAFIFLPGITNLFLDMERELNPLQCQPNLKQIYMNRNNLLSRGW